MFYGWRIVAVAFLTHCVTTGIVFYSFGVFLHALSEHFAWSRAEVSLGFSLLALCGAAYAPAVGRFIDRYGPRASQLFGALTMGLGFVLLSRLDSLNEYYLLMGAVVSLGATALGQLPSNTAVANWFVRRRGIALGIATAGISMGGVIFVPLTQFLVDQYDWRRAFQLLGIIVVVVVMPPVVAFMRRSPESMGLQPDGGAAEPSADPLDFESESARSWTPYEAVRHRNFWLIAVAFALAMMGIVSILLHLIAYLGDRGVSAADASWVLGATAGLGVAGKLAFGALHARIEQRRLIIACFAIQALGLVLLAAATNTAVLVGFVVVYGFAMGGTATLQAAAIAECFGRVHYAGVTGRMMPLVVIIEATGLPIVGAARDAAGTYLPAFAGIFVTIIVAMVCIAAVDQDARPPRSAAAGEAVRQ